MPYSRPKLDWRPILLEASFVVFGVVIALAANEWRRAHLDRQNAATALASIRDELRANRDAVIESVHYHVQLGDTLASLTRHAANAGAAGSAPRPDVRLFARGFFQPATLLHTAWDAAAATDAVRHMRYTDVLQLARVNEDQERYRRQSDQVGQLIYAHLFSHGYNGVVQNYANLVGILATFWYRECQLLQRYEEVLSQIGGPAEADSPELPERCRHIAAQGP